METREHIIGKLTDIADEYKRKYRLKRIGLFGSVARNEATEDSDIDIVIEFDKPNLFLQAELMLKLKALFGRDVDVISIWKHMNPKLKARIDREAIYV